jgi:hypothetical protein
MHRDSGSALFTGSAAAVVGFREMISSSLVAATSSIGGGGGGGLGAVGEHKEVPRDDSVSTALATTAMASQHNPHRGSSSSFTDVASHSSTSTQVSHSTPQPSTVMPSTTKNLLADANFLTIQVPASLVQFGNVWSENSPGISPELVDLIAGSVKYRHRGDVVPRARVASSALPGDISSSPATTTASAPITTTADGSVDFDNQNVVNSTGTSGNMNGGQLFHGQVSGNSLDGDISVENGDFEKNTENNDFVPTIEITCVILSAKMTTLPVA